MNCQSNDRGRDMNRGSNYTRPHHRSFSAGDQRRHPDQRYNRQNWAHVQSNSGRNNQVNSQTQPGQRFSKFSGYQSGKRCYKCDQFGHIQSSCPRLVNHVVLDKTWERGMIPTDVFTLPGEVIQFSCLAQGDSLSRHIFPG